MNLGNEFWVFIPARAGSKSIKNKNIKKLGKYPLIAYSIFAAKKLKIAKRIIFSSDSKRYLNIAKKYGCKFLHKRDKKYAKDKTSDLEVFKNYLFFLKNKKIVPPKYFIHLRPTTPLRSKKEMLKAINFFKKNSKKYSALRSVSTMSNPSQKTMLINNKKLCSIVEKDFNLDKYNGPKELFPKTYLPNGYIDIVKTKNILANKFHGNKVLPFITKEFNSDVDSIDDFKYVQYRIGRKK